MSSDARAYWEQVTHVDETHVLLVRSVKDIEDKVGFITMPISREAFTTIGSETVLKLLDDAAESVVREHNNEIAERGSNPTLFDSGPGSFDIHG